MTMKNVSNASPSIIETAKKTADAAISARIAQRLRPENTSALTTRPPSSGWMGRRLKTFTSALTDATSPTR